MSPKRCLMLVLALLTCTMSGCNSRICWPQNEFWPVVGFFAVCFLFFGGFRAVLMGEADIERTLCGVTMWIVAGLLLQFVPHAESGLQVVPLPPWNYSGWIGWIVSAVCWWRLIIGCYYINADTLDATRASHGVLAGLALTCLLSFCSLSNATTPSIADNHPALAESCQGKIEQWEKLRDERLEALKKLAFDRSVLVARIKGLGARTKQEIMAHAVGRTLVEELEQLYGQTVRLQSETDAIEAVLERAKSMVRRIEREAMLKGLGVTTEAKYDQLNELDHQLQGELRKLAGEPVPGSEVRIDKVLDAVFHQREGGN